VQIGGENWLVNMGTRIQPPSKAEIAVNECFANYRLNWQPGERNFYMQSIGLLTISLMKARLMLRCALKLSHSRSGNFAVIFALMLPVFAAIITFIADQAKMAHLQSRVSAARDAAMMAAAHEYVQGSKSHGSLKPMRETSSSPISARNMRRRPVSS
jgi:hypothetical protein